MDIQNIIKLNYSLKENNWWKVGGAAQFYAEPTSIQQVQELVLWASKNDHAVTCLGDGSNCLVSDQGITGLTVCLKSLVGIISDDVVGGRYVIKCLAGTGKMQIMRLFLKRKLTPALFLSGLPGQVGGGIVMNAGVREQRDPREFCEITDGFTIVDLKTAELRDYKFEDIKWSYRHTEGWAPGIIVAAQLSWPDDADEDVPKLLVDANKARKARQPLEYPSGGSTFKNPSPSKSAGFLIESAGLKGLAVGGAQVSEKHANFIVNTGDASALDVLNVINQVIEKVETTHGIKLQTEVRKLGTW